MNEGAGEIRALIEACVQVSEQRVDVTHEGIWLRIAMSRLDPQLRAGWKIHLSATPHRYGGLLHRALPLLLDAGLPFKCADASSTVEKLNSGEFGLSQVGKAVTVYVGAAARVSSLGAALAKALQDFPGPRIIHDCRLSEHAPVYARFGPFDGVFRVDPTGRSRRILLHPELGELIDPTDGGPVNYPDAPGIPSYEPHDHLAFIRDRFIIARLLHLSAKGGVFLAMDRQAPDAGLQLLKTARAWTNSDSFGRDARWALRREHAWLKRLAGLPGVPPAGTLLEGDEATVLCRPHLEGETFWELWTQPDARSPVGQTRLHQIIDELEGIIARFHKAGCIVRDLSPGNILVDDDTVWILDFELGEAVHGNATPYRRGTKGFYPEDRERDAPAAASDDHYALARLRSMAQGISPQSPLKKEEVATLSDTNTHKQIIIDKHEDRSVASEDARHAILDQVLKHYQTTTPLLKEDPEAQTLYDGSAGLCLFLFEYGGFAPGPRPESTTAFDTEKWRQGLKQLRHLPGLHFGASGLALALCHYGARNDENLQREGRDCLVKLSRELSPIPDICQGIAGLGLAAWAARSVLPTRDLETILDSVGAQLQAQCVEDADGVWWPWPEGAAYGGFSGQTYLGFAHGLAGILWLASTVKASLGSDLLPPSMIERGFATLLRHGQPLPDGGMWWPVSRRDETCWNAWCHGTPGVVKALVAGYEAGCVESDRIRAGLVGIGAANSGELCRCHGVASRLDAYADAFGALPILREAAMIRDAAEADRALLAVALRQGLDGTGLMVPGKGLMTGLAGIAHALFRYDLGIDAFGIDGIDGQLLP